MVRVAGMRESGGAVDRERSGGEIATHGGVGRNDAFKVERHK